MFRTSRTLLTLALTFTSLPVLSYGQNSGTTGAVFVMTNDAEKNEVISFKRNADGSLTDRHTYKTGGRGSGGLTDPLGSQDSLLLTQDNSFLLAVNAGSGEISVFQVSGSTLTWLGNTPCAGSEPIAVAQHDHFVYVLNAGGTSNVTGFHLTSSGILKQLPNSTAFLTTGNSGAASLTFSPDGKFLAVTEKLTNNIDVFPLQSNGTLGAIVTTASAGPGLFGVTFAPNGTAITTETGPTGGQNASAVSSYALNATGTLSAISASVPTLSNATCWHVVTPNGKSLYTTNPGSGSLSGFTIGSTGALTPIAGTVLATLPSGSTNLDVATSQDGKYLYTIDAGTATVTVLAVNSDGSLTITAEVSGLPADTSFNGIAAF